MVLLNLGTAFDSVDHNILLEQPCRDVGIRGKVLDWFSSYLSNWGQQVSINGLLSWQLSLDCSIPQGSCLGPSLFVIYTSSLLKVIEHHLLQVHCFADDMRLYLSFRTDDDNKQDEPLHAMERCIRDLWKWLIDGRLLLNDHKTEFLVISTRRQLNKVGPLSLQVGDHNIDPWLNARNLGAIIDNSLRMNNHINQKCKACL